MALRKHLFDRLTNRNTYVVTLVVGTLINGYGQLLVPYMRGDQQPLARIGLEWERHPSVLALSIALGYCFPLVVGVLSAVMTRLEDGGGGGDAS